MDTQVGDWSVLTPGFDLVFVDGDHSSGGVRSDTRNVFGRLRDERSVIVWHDYCLHTPGKINWPVLAGIMDGCPADLRKHLYHVSNTLCAVFIRQHLPTRPLDLAEYPNKVFSIRIQAKPV